MGAIRVPLPRRSDSTSRTSACGCESTAATTTRFQPLPPAQCGAVWIPLPSGQREPIPVLTTPLRRTAS